MVSLLAKGWIPQWKRESDVGVPLMREEGGESRAIVSATEIKIRGAIKPILNEKGAREKEREALLL